MIAVATFQQGNSNNYAFPVSELAHIFLVSFIRFRRSALLIFWFIDSSSPTTDDLTRQDFN